jgi:hypothetical protein
LIKQNAAAQRDLILIKLIFCTAIIVNGRLATGFPNSSAHFAGQAANDHMIYNAAVL